TDGTGTIINRFEDGIREGGKGYTLQLKDGKVEMMFAYRVPDHALRVETEKPIELNRWHHVMVTYAGIREAKYLTLYVDGAAQKLNIMMDVLNETNPVKEPLRIGGGAEGENAFHGLIDEVRVYNTDLSPEEIGILSVSKTLNELALSLPAQRSQAESDKIRRAFLDSAAVPTEIQLAFRQLTSLREQRAQFYESISTVMVMEEMPTPRETHLLIRGSYDQPGERVTPGVPAVLPSIPEDF